MTLILLRYLSVLVVLAGCGTQLFAQFLPERPVDGAWSIVEGNYGGMDYGGEVAIITAGSQKALRRESGEAIYHGIGFYLDTTLYVGWGSGPSYGLVLYTIRPNGTLDGTWTYAGNEDIPGTEHAIGGSLEEPSTTYTVNGVNPGGGGEYSGTLAITRTGQTWQLHWEVGDVSYDGVGIRYGNRMVVGWGGSEKNYAVTAYAVEADRVVGIRALPDRPELGREVLGRIIDATPGK